MRAEDALRVVVSLATAVMLGLSWPLWVEPSSLPRVPFLGGVPQSPPVLSWLLFAGLLGALGASLFGRWPRWSTAAWGTLLVVLILQDQHRFQPWTYQAIVTALALAVSGGPGGLMLCRFFLIGLYFHSGLSKLDASFLHDLGPFFLNAGGRLAGVDPSQLPDQVRTALVLAMPSFELAVALGLVFRRTRWFALAGAVLIHLILIGLLGPWALRQSTIVLVWNVSVLAQALVLFGWPGRDDSPIETDRPAFRIGSLAVGLLLVLPLGERLGWFDSWPSFALYASHVERLEFRVVESDAEALDESARRCLFPVPGTPWRRLDLTAWSRSVRGTPVYPQNRANIGLVLGLLGHSAEPITFQVVLQGRARPISGRRDSEEVQTIADLERQTGRYWLNGRPASRNRDR